MVHFCQMILSHLKDDAVTDTPHLQADKLPQIEDDRLFDSNEPVKILILYGSLRERSFSRLAAEEGARILNCAEVADLPLSMTKQMKRTPSRDRTDNVMACLVITCAMAP